MGDESVNRSVTGSGEPCYIIACVKGENHDGDHLCFCGEAIRLEIEP